MITADEARARTFAHKNQSGIMFLLEDIEATVIYHCASGDTNASYMPPYKLTDAQVESVLYFLRVNNFKCEYYKRGFFMIWW